MSKSFISSFLALGLLMSGSAFAQEETASSEEVVVLPDDEEAGSLQHDEEVEVEKKN